MRIRTQPRIGPARRVFVAAAFAAICLFAPAARPEDINALRQAQTKELKALEQKYDAMARQAAGRPDGTVDTSNPRYQQIKNDYIRRVQEVRTKYAQMDPRTQDTAQTIAKSSGQISLSGSNPKDVRADVDLTAKTDSAADRVAAEWKARGDVVEYDAARGKYINKTTDTTLWQPATPERNAARQSDPDAFVTPGGKAASGVKGSEAVSDPKGFVLDNEQKFVHAGAEGDLKTQGKSVSKAAVATGVQSETAQQANRLRNYQDVYEAGVANLGESDAVKQQNIQSWQQKADRELQEMKQAADQSSALKQQVRRQLAEQAAKNSGPNDALDGKTTAQAIQDRINAVNEGNAAAEARNQAAREQAGLTQKTEGQQTAAGSDSAGKTAPDGATATGTGPAAVEGKQAGGTTAADQGGAAKSDSATPDSAAKAPARGPVPVTKESFGASHEEIGGVSVDSSHHKAVTTIKDGDRTTETTAEKDTVNIGGGKITQTTESTSTTTEDGAQKTTTGKSTTETKIGGVGIQSTTESSSRSTEEGANKVTTGKSTTETKVGGVTIQKTTEISGEAEHKFGDGKQKAPEADEDKSSVTKSVKIAETKLFDDVDKELGKKEGGTGYQSKDGNTEAFIGGKVQVGQYGAQGKATLTADGDGLKGQATIQGEANVYKAGMQGSAEHQIADGVKVKTEGKLESKAGIEGQATVEGTINSKEIAAGGKVGVFVGMKNSGEVSGTLDMNESLGMSLTGKAQGELNLGAGAEGSFNVKIGWGGIKVQGKASLTWGVGAGGGLSVDLDASKAVFGVSESQTEFTNKKMDVIHQLNQAIKSGEYKFPDGANRMDIRNDMELKAQWLLKHPEVLSGVTGPDGKPIDPSDPKALAGVILGDSKLEKGGAKDGGTSVTTGTKEPTTAGTKGPDKGSEKEPGDKDGDDKGGEKTGGTKSGKSTESGTTAAGGGKGGAATGNDLQESEPMAEAPEGGYGGGKGGKSSGVLEGFVSGADSKNEQTASESFGTMQQNSQLGQASTAGDQAVAGAQGIIEGGGQQAQTTKSQTSSEIAQTDQQNSWGSTLGNAIADGVKQGGESFGSAIGGAAAGAVSSHIFGGGKGGGKAGGKGGGGMGGAGEDDEEDEGISGTGGAGGGAGGGQVGVSSGGSKDDDDDDEKVGKKGGKGGKGGGKDGKGGKGGKEDEGGQGGDGGQGGGSGVPTTTQTQKSGSFTAKLVPSGNSYYIEVSGVSSNQLSATVSGTDGYSASFSGTGSIKSSTIPAGASGVNDTVVAKDLVTGETATFNFKF